MANPIKIVTIPHARVGNEYSTQLAVENAKPTDKYKYQLGTNGSDLQISLSATGLLSMAPRSTPESVGIQFTVLVVPDAAPNFAGASPIKITMFIDPELEITPVDGGNSWNARVGSLFRIELKVKDGDGNYTWELNERQLPVGIGINKTTGVITGTPTEAVDVHWLTGASSHLHLRAKSSKPNMSVVEKVSRHIHVYPALLLSYVADKATPLAVIGRAYKAQLVAQHAAFSAGHLNYSVFKSTENGHGATEESIFDLKTIGLTLNKDTGEISGTPTGSEEDYELLFKVNDVNNYEAKCRYTLSIQASASITLSPATTPISNRTFVGEQFALNVVASGGSEPYVFTVKSTQNISKDNVLYDHTSNSIKIHGTVPAVTNELDEFSVVLGVTDKAQNTNGTNGTTYTFKKGTRVVIRDTNLVLQPELYMDEDFIYNLANLAEGMPFTSVTVQEPAGVTISGTTMTYKPKPTDRSGLTVKFTINNRYDSKAGTLFVKAFDARLQALAPQGPQVIHLTNSATRILLPLKLSAQTKIEEIIFSQLSDFTITADLANPRLPALNILPKPGIKSGTEDTIHYALYSHNKQSSNVQTMNIVTEK